jgi:hypothetical protein
MQPRAAVQPLRLWAELEPKSAKTGALSLLRWQMISLIRGGENLRIDRFLDHELVHELAVGGSTRKKCNSNYHDCESES